MNQRIYNMKFKELYPMYVQKAERKGRQQKEVDEILMWLTGYNQKALDIQIAQEDTVSEFFDLAPQMNPNRFLVTGVVCGVRVEEVKEPLMQTIRQLDKMVDELAKGKTMDKILRKNP
ncbi:MAG: DUF2200 domain-containing protein [Anaerorhabdus sp.]